MAEYPIRFTSDVTQAVAGIDQLIAALRTLDALSDQIRPKLAGLAKDLASPVNAASKAVDKLNASLGVLDTLAVTASGAVAGVGTAATGAATGIAAVGTAATSTNRRLGAAAASATAMGGALNGVATQATTAALGLQHVGASAGMLPGLFGSVQTSSVGAGRGIGSISTAGAGLAVVVGLAGSMADAFRESREFAEECAAEVTRLDDSVRELRMTMGKGTTTKEASDSVVELMLASGADQKKAAAFNTMWESTVFAAKKKGNWGLNEKETKEAKGQALSYAVASGMDEKTIGEVVPLIGVGEKISSTEQLLGKLGTMGRLAVEGVGNLTPMMKVYEKLRGTMVRPAGGGAFKSSEELMAAISSTSVTAGNVPAVTTAMNQVWRDLSFADNDQKKETFKQLGIKPGDDYQTRVNKITPLVEGAAARGKTELEALFEAGFHRTGSNPKIVQAVTERSILRENLDIARQAPKGADVIRENERFRAENPNRFAANAVEAAKLKRGRETQDLEVMKKFAEADATNRAGLNRASMNFFENIIDMKIPSMIPLVGGKSISQDVLGEESGRQKILDSIVSGHIQAVVPDANKRFPNLSGQIEIPGINRVNPTFQPARGPALAKIIRDLTPEERSKVMARMERHARPDFGSAKGKQGDAPPKLQPLPALGPAPGQADQGIKPVVAPPAIQTIPGQAPVADQGVAPQAAPAGNAPIAEHPPAEKADLSGDFSVIPEWNATEMVPAIRPGAAMAPKAPKAGAEANQAPLPGKPGAGDAALLNVNRDQLRKLHQIVDALRPRSFGGGGGGGIGPLPVDGGDFGERRV